MKTNAQAIHVYSIGDDLYLAVEVDKEWIVIGKIYAPLNEQTISYIFEPNAAPMAAPRPST